MIKKLLLIKKMVPQQLFKNRKSGRNPQKDDQNGHWLPLKAHLCLWDGVLYRCWESISGDKEHWQLVVLKSLIKKDILRQVHDAPIAGHLGTKKTLARVRGRFL